jgi:hypothetical protein
MCKKVQPIFTKGTETETETGENNNTGGMRDGGWQGGLSIIQNLTWRILKRLSCKLQSIYMAAPNYIITQPPGYG